MGTQMRKWMDDFQEYVNKTKNRDIIISYDISSDYNKFRSDLLELMEDFGKTEITQSTYKLNRRINGEELDELCEKIMRLFEEIKLGLNEANTRAKRVRVVIITSIDNTLFEEVLIDEEI
jgi:hypothetical protein